MNLQGEPNIVLLSNDGKPSVGIAQETRESSSTLARIIAYHGRIT